MIELKMVLHYQVKHHQTEVLLLHPIQKKTNNQILKTHVHSGKSYKETIGIRWETAPTSPLEKNKERGDNQSTENAYYD